MIGIGFRASPSYVYYSTYNSEKKEVLLDRNRVTVPAALEGPNLLQLMRTNIIDIISAHAPEAGFVKESDFHHRQTKNRSRIYLEGVIQEAVASSDIQYFDSGDSKKLTNLLRIESEELKRYKKGTDTYMNLPEWGESSDNAPRESILSAIAATKLNS